MIIGTCFEGDNNEPLKEWQHDWYNDCLMDMLSIAADTIEEHRDNQRLTNLVKLWDDNNLYDEPFDHRIMQECHDTVAISFRFCERHEIIETEKIYTKIYWREFFRKIVTATMQEEYALRSFVEALVYANTEDGYEAEDMLSSALQTECDKHEPDVIQLELFPE